MAESQIRELLNIDLVDLMKFLSKRLIAVNSENFYDNFAKELMGDEPLYEPCDDARAVVHLRTSEITSPDGGTLWLGVEYFGNNYHKFLYTKIEHCTMSAAKRLDAVLNEEINEHPIHNLSYEKNLG